MSQHPEIWSETITYGDIASLHSAVNYFQGLNKSTTDMMLDDFPLSNELIAKIEKWKYQLGPQGRGFQLVRGIPVEQWSMEQCEIFFWAFGKYLGIPGAQDVEGSLLGHVTDAGETKNRTERPYRKRVEIAYHCDGADIVGLLCIHPARSGGESRIISSVSVFNELLQSSANGQKYVSRLFDKVLLFTRKTFGLSSNIPLHPFRLDSDGILRTYWNQEYYAKSYRENNGTLTSAGLSDSFALEAINAYDNILVRDMKMREKRVTGISDNFVELSTELGLDMNLQQGDIQLVSNHYVMHARTEFVDYSDAEILLMKSNELATDGHPKVSLLGKRDLLRLWVSETTENMPWKLLISKKIDLCRVLLGLLEGVIWYR
jgi:hypothetical protein